MREYHTRSFSYKKTSWEHQGEKILDNLLEKCPHQIVLEYPCVLLSEERMHRDKVQKIISEEERLDGVILFNERITSSNSVTYKIHFSDLNSAIIFKMIVA